MLEEQRLINNILSNIETVVIDKRLQIMNIIKGIISNGHILIEDVPGVGKTTLIKTLARTLDLSFSRIQFTPDLLPSDITGISIYNQKEMQFEFKKGPIFANIVLADEINRTSPKTQSALLEVMEENQISEGGNTYRLESPFFVLATQNPIEHGGTYILPEAQLDRFMIKVSIGYPDKIGEERILERYRKDEPLKEIESVAGASEILKLQKAVRNIFAAKEVNSYIVDIVQATRENNYLALGGSPRASLSLLRISQASALIKGRNYVIPEDVQENVLLVLKHRICVSPAAKAKGYTEEKILLSILQSVKVPRVSLNA